MKRIIKFSIDPKKENYIFQEDNIQEDNINIFKINVKDKILNGKDFYKIFFQNYNPDDKFEFIDNTSDQEKISDKMCKQIYEKMVELFTEVEKTINDEIFLKNKEEK